MDLKTLYIQTKDRFKAAKIDNADWEARFLIKYALKIDDSAFITASNDQIEPEKLAELDKIIDERMADKPIGMITGRTEFWSLPFKVNEHVLEPRQDSETLIEAVLKRYKDQKRAPETILDLGAGSGCLCLSLLHEFPTARGVAVDISVDALGVAQENANLNNLSDRITFIKGDWFDALENPEKPNLPKTGKGDNMEFNGQSPAIIQDLPRKYDLIVSNPPYISNQEIANLAPEVQNHDPILALDGGNDGLDSYKKIISSLKNYLIQGGFCFLEIGYDQSESVTRLVKNTGLSVEAVHADLAGHARVVEISFGENMQK